MVYILKLFIARFRVRLHYFLYLHKSEYNHWITGDSAVVWKVSCKFCKKVFYLDKEISRIQVLPIKPKEEENGPRAEEHNK